MHSWLLCRGSIYIYVRARMHMHIRVDKKQRKRVGGRERERERRFLSHGGARANLPVQDDVRSFVCAACLSFSAREIRTGVCPVVKSRHVAHLLLDLGTVNHRQQARLS